MMDKTGIKLAPGIIQREDKTLAIEATATIASKKRFRRAVLPEGTTLEQAQQAREQLRRELTGEVEAAPPITTLSDYAVGWLASKAERLRPRVVGTYTTILAWHILPQMGELALTEIKRSHVEGWVVYAEGARLASGAGYSRPTLTGWWRLLVQLLRDAAADHDLRDPTERVQAPRVQTPGVREQRTLTSDQLALLLKAAAEYTPDRYAEIATLAYTGMRAGELYGLRWEDVDASAECLHIRHSASKGHTTAPKGGATRVVYAPAAVLDALADHRRWLIEEQHVGLETGLVFPSDVGTSRDANSLAKPLAIASVSAGLDLRVTPQVLRRTFNTLLVASGADRIVMRSQMGHSSEAMTERYSGVTLELKRKVVQGAFK
jgi:integrase